METLVFSLVPVFRGFTEGWQDIVPASQAESHSVKFYNMLVLDALGGLLLLL